LNTLNQILQTAIALFKFGYFKQLYSILGNFKQLHSNLGNIQVVYQNLDAIKNIWVNSNNLNRIWLTETVSFKLGYCWIDLREIEKVHTDLHIL